MPKHKPTLDGRELTDAELQQIRQILESFDGIGTISVEMRSLIEQQWPHLLAKIRVHANNGMKRLPTEATLLFFAPKAEQVQLAWPTVRSCLRLNLIQVNTLALHP